MDNKDSNMKPQQTGGLKLMTVFIAVLALHVVVIGGVTVYHLMSGGDTDADLVSSDKTHKDLKGMDGTSITEGTLPEMNPAEKSAPTPPAETTPAPTPAPAEVAAAPAIPPAPTPAPDQSAEMATPASAPTAVPASAPAPAPVPAAPAAMPANPPAEVVDKGSDTPTGPIRAPLAPPPEETTAATPVTPAPAPEPAPEQAPIASGPVHMPPAFVSAPAHESMREHRQIYTVKITDSYKKIAHAHHVTVAELKEANHIHGDVLHTGQKLIIPSNRALVATSESSTSLDATPAHPMFANSVSSVGVTTLAHHHLYTVVKGDTLRKIAHRFRTTATAIMDANDISNPGKLTIGKKLRIPSPESRSARNNAPTSPPPAQVRTSPEDASSGQLANFIP